MNVISMLFALEHKTMKKGTKSKHRTQTVLSKVSGRLSVILDVIPDSRIDKRLSN